MNRTISVFLPILILAVLVSGQASKPKNVTQGDLPVALGKIYQLPQKTAEPIEGTSPTMLSSRFDALVAVIEWHFEMRFTDAERREYQRIIVGLWNNDAKIRGNIEEFYTYLNKLQGMSSFDVSSELNARIRNDIWDLGMIELSPTSTRTSFRGKIYELYKQGNEESIFLWKKITDYEKPLAPGNKYNKPLTRKHIDATIEWTAYQINVVANKEVFVLDDEKRNQMEKILIDRWKKEVSETDTVTSDFILTLGANVGRWSDLKIKKGVSFDGYITNYNKLSTMVEWAKTAFYYCPSIKPYAEKRIKEYQDYSAKMSNDEWQLEFYRLQQEMKVQNMALSMMKEQQLKAHVINMNIAESLGGDPKYEWVIKKVP